MTNATAIRYERYAPDMPEPQDMMTVYGTLERLMIDLGTPPTHFSADDGKGRVQYREVGGAFHREFLEEAAAGFRSIGLASAVGSDAPSVAPVQLAFDFAPEAGRVTASLVASDMVLQCGSPRCDMVVMKYAGLWKWDYGFGFERPLATVPMVYLAGAASDLQSTEDQRRGELWYLATQDFYKRLPCPRPLLSVRDVFPYNVIGRGHLDRQLPDGATLEEFIVDDPDSELRPVTPELWLWKVKLDRTEAVRNKLRGTGVIISE